MDCVHLGGEWPVLTIFTSFVEMVLEAHNISRVYFWGETNNNDRHRSYSLCFNCFMFIRCSIVLLGWHVLSANLLADRFSDTCAREDTGILLM